MVTTLLFPPAIALVFTLGTVAPATTRAIEVSAHRPDPTGWKRTQCGSPSGKHGPIPAQPAVPPGKPWQLETGMDCGGSDLPGPCRTGCTGHNVTQASCEARCKATKDCVAYIFAEPSCNHGAGTCWLKKSCEPKPTKNCRAAALAKGMPGRPAKPAQPAGPGADIPSKYAAEVSASSTPLVKFPRPQMVRGSGAPADLRDAGDPKLWVNLNGLWEWEPTTADTLSSPPFGKTLAGSILVPFPVESCLSGVAPNSSATIVKNMWYRLTFDATVASAHATLLHFGAIDWQSTIFLNGQQVGNNTGGYNGIDIDISSFVKPTQNELLVYVFDPSDTGKQPNGKQRISAIDRPGGDTYTPSSGIWQTVWVEQVPELYIEAIKINQSSLSAVEVIASVGGTGDASAMEVSFEVMDAGTSIAKASGQPGTAVSISIPSPKLWSPTSPTLYDLKITIGSDTVLAYFGLRTFQLGDGPKGKRTLLNGKFTFAAGFLDQSWWPDGQYTAPTDEGLAYDIQAVPMFGLNMIRLHQKVNPERWYYHADRIGVLIFQDMVQKYGGASNETIPYFVEDFKAMVAGRGNHPCIVQFETFNEGDCWGVFKTKPFDVASIVALSKQLAPDRLVDTDSGGGANNLHIGDVNDIHSYPYPGDPEPSASQYAMIGEFGGIGAFVEGKEWKPNACHTYLHTDTPQEEADTYIKMAATIASRVDHVSASVYTQTTDLELECDGFLNYDRTNKFTSAQTAAIRKANQAIIHAADGLADNESF